MVDGVVGGAWVVCGRQRKVRVEFITTRPLPRDLAPHFSKHSNALSRLALATPTLSQPRILRFLEWGACFVLHPFSVFSTLIYRVLTRPPEDSDIVVEMDAASVAFHLCSSESPIAMIPVPGHQALKRELGPDFTSVP
jgi:hypothetical protein